MLPPNRQRRPRARLAADPTPGARAAEGDNRYETAVERCTLPLPTADPLRVGPGATEEGTQRLREGAQARHRARAGAVLPPEVLSRDFVPQPTRAGGRVRVRL